MTNTLLITGAAGFIGSNFVELAVSRGYKVIILDALTYAGHKENLTTIPAKTWELIQGDIRDAKLIPTLLEKYQPAAFINFAAESHVDRSITGPAEFIETNIAGTFNLLRCSLDYWQKLEGPAKEKFRYVQISTDEVYGSLGPTGKFSETTPIAPNSPYSASKASADLLTRAWFHTYGLPTITTNCSNNYGPKQFPEKLIPHMIQCALSNRPLPVYGDGGNVRDWIHVRDHCAGVLLALEKGRPGETYCFGGNAERNNLDVVNTICRLLDEMRPRTDGKSHSTGISFVTDRLGHDRRYAIDDTKAERELGFKRRYEFESGLADTVKWYLENDAWVKAVLSKGGH
jgi:dTDP-glucose 4,6-dehydratase